MHTLSNKNIFGNWATLLLATDRDGRIDYPKLSNEIDVLIASRPNGIYSNGTAGEFYTQSEDEFDRISLLLSEKCKKAGISYQLGVSHTSPQTSLQRLRRVKHLRPGAVQLILPDWFPVTLDEAIAFLQGMEEEADGISLVLYNPPHAKTKLTPEQWPILKEQIPSLAGLKVFDQNAAPQWYALMRTYSRDLSIFVPGHRLATGIMNGAHGSYSNMACLNPFAAQQWYELIHTDQEAAFDLERRITIFMQQFIEPLITVHHYANQACDRFLALLGGWADVGDKMRWPYRSVPHEYAAEIRMEGKKTIPEFFLKTP